MLVKIGKGRHPTTLTSTLHIYTYLVEVTIIINGRIADTAALVEIMEEFWWHIFEPQLLSQPLT